MRGRIVKSILGLFVFVVLLSCTALVISEAASTPAASGGTSTTAAATTPAVTAGGKVPVNYMATDAYSESRLAEGKAMFTAKCAICHTDSGRDLVYFGDPDFNSARVIGSVKKFVGASSDPEIGEKVYEYLRYNNDGPFTSQNTPFLQPGPKDLAPGNANPVLSKDSDFWGALTGHKTATPDDINLDKVWKSYDMTNVIVPYAVSNWSEFIPHEVPLAKATTEIKALFNAQKYDLKTLPLADKGLGLSFNYATNTIYTKYQFSSHDYSRMSHSKDAIEAVYSTSLLTWLGVLDFEYGLPQRVNNAWNSTWAWGPHENQILWGPGSNLDNINSYGINQYESISSREALRNKWTQYSTMFVTGSREDFKPSSYYWYATMPWGCKTYDAGTFGGSNVQLFTGLKGFAEMYNHSQAYPGTTYAGVYGIRNYGAATRKYLTDMYWQFEGLPTAKGDKQALVNVFIEVIYRQWKAAIGVTDSQFRTLISDSYNLPDGQRDQQRYTTYMQSYQNLQSAMTNDQKEFVKAYMRRIYPTNPSSYYGTSKFIPGSWYLLDPAPAKPIILPFGSDTAVAGTQYVLRILRDQAKDGDITITASDLPAGATLVKTKGNWQNNDFEYAINWTPTADQAGKTYTVTLTGTSTMGTNQTTTAIKVVSAAADPVALSDIPAYSVYEGQQLTFPLTVQNYNVSNLSFSMDGTFGKVINNTWNTAGIYSVTPAHADVGLHTVSFTVKDAQGNTSTKTASITVLANSAPVVVMTPAGSGPGANKNIYRVRVGDTLKLTFANTDADGDKIEVSKNPEFPGTINNNVYTYTVDEAMAKNFPGPNVLTFTVKDMIPNSNPYAMPQYKGGVVKKVLLVYFETKDASTNHTPWAQTGSAQTVKSGATVTLDGSISDDSDKDPITYLWTQQTGQTVKFSDATAVKPTFVAPTVTEPTVFKFYLTVKDPGGLTDSTVVRVTVTP
jgi:hypothetical protein